MKRVHVWIKGMVQGIFFRAFLAEKAEKLKIKGFCRNVDKKVEAVFEGDNDAIKWMLEYCKKGPDIARIDDIKIKEETYAGEFDDFKILH